MNRTEAYEIEYAMRKGKIPKNAKRLQQARAIIQADPTDCYLAYLARMGEQYHKTPLG